MSSNKLIIMPRKQATVRWLLGQQSELNSVDFQAKKTSEIQLNFQ